jgi:hypothetical protein
MKPVWGRTVAVENPAKVFFCCPSTWKRRRRRR